MFSDISIWMFFTRSRIFGVQFRQVLIMIKIWSHKCLFISLIIHSFMYCSTLSFVYNLFLCIIYADITKALNEKSSTRETKGKISFVKLYTRVFKVGSRICNTYWRIHRNMERKFCNKGMHRRIPLFPHACTFVRSMLHGQRQKYIYIKVRGAYVDAQKLTEKLMIRT